MSYKNFEIALEKAQECEYYFKVGKRESTVIKKAQEVLKIKFSKQLDFYLNNVGSLTFFGNEFYGIFDDDFEDGYTPMMVNSTIVDREKLSMPHSYLHLWDAGDGAIGVLDYSQLNDEGEPPVLLVDYRGEEQGWVVIETMAEDLGDFLLQCVENQLANQ